MYQVFALKWRPQKFEDIVGQDSAARTLQNAIESGQIHHAYLFSGPRGIGKTSIARIFAKALNCENGPSKEPCNKCANCLAITRGNCVDVNEIDGASNNSVDDIRTLREHVLVAPMSCRYKIYIIDEVHMLSVAAFNALLKTLEEPPPHIKFMFATTEPHKIPATIISRCQRFDLRRISTNNIIGRLIEIAKDEGIEITPDAVEIIARNSDGAMRDAQSIFDQIASSFGKSISTGNVTEILGIASGDLFWDLDIAVSEGNVEKGFEIADAVVKDGKHITRFIEDMIMHFRNLLVAKSTDDPGVLLDMGDEAVKKYKEYADRFRREQLLYMMDVLAETLERMRFGGSPRVKLEMAITRIIRSSDRVYIDDLLDKLRRNDGGTGDLFGNRGGSSSVVREEAAKPDESSGGKSAPSATSSSKEIPLQELTRDDKKELGDVWGKILEGLTKTSKRLKAQLSCGKLIEVDNAKNVVKIGFLPKDSFHADTLSSKENLELIKDSFVRHLGKNMDVVVQKIDAVKAPKDTGKDKSLMNSAIVQKAHEIFGGKFLNSRR